MDKEKYIEELAFELMHKPMTKQDIVQRLSNLWDIAEIEGQKKLNKIPEPTPYKEYTLGDTPKCPICHFSLEDNHSCIENITESNC